MGQNRIGTRSIGYLLEAKEAIHVGSGEGSGWIDLPIEKEAVTGYPVINDTTWKGAIRHQVMQKSFEGTILSFTDLRLLLFPIQSSRHIFSYVTCPDLLERFIKATEKHQSNQKIDQLPIRELKKTMKDRQVFGFNKEKEIMLGNISFQSKEIKEPLEQLINQMIVGYLKPDDIQKRLVIVSDSNFREYIMKCTEKKIRNQLDKNKNSMQVFSQEYLPENTVMYGFITEFYNVKTRKMDNVIEEVKRKMPKILYIGGDHSIGKGSFCIHRREEKDGQWN